MQETEKKKGRNAMKVRKIKSRARFLFIALLAVLGAGMSSAANEISVKVVDDATGEPLPDIPLRFLSYSYEFGELPKSAWGGQMVLTDSTGEASIQWEGRRTLIIRMGADKETPRMMSERRTFPYVGTGAELFSTEDVSNLAKQVVIRLMKAASAEVEIKMEGATQGDKATFIISTDKEPSPINNTGTFDLVDIGGRKMMEGVVPWRDSWMMVRPAQVAAGVERYRYVLWKRVEAATLEPEKLTKLSVTLPAMPKEPTLVGWVVGKNGERDVLPKWAYYAQRENDGATVIVPLMPFGLTTDTQRKIEARLTPGRWKIKAFNQGLGRALGDVDVPEGGLVDYGLVDEKSQDLSAKE